MFHKLFNVFGLPETSTAGHTLGLFGRLTYRWLWTDDPKLGEIDQQLDAESDQRRYLRNQK
jgi:hypothetical protein